MPTKSASPTKNRRNAAVLDLAPDIARVKGLIAKAKLPAVEEGPSYGMPSFKVAGKFLGRVREPGVFVLTCALEEKEFLMETQPAVYFETDHYKGWPAVLIRLPKIGDEELMHRLAAAWRRQAPKKLHAALEGAPTPRPVHAPRAQARMRRPSGKR